MKRVSKKMLFILALTLAVCLTAGGVAYAAWVNEAVSSNNTITTGSPVTYQITGSQIDGGTGLRPGSSATHTVTADLDGEASGTFSIYGIKAYKTADSEKTEITVEDDAAVWAFLTVTAEKKASGGAEFAPVAAAFADGVLSFTVADGDTIKLTITLNDGDTYGASEIPEAFSECNIIYTLKLQ